MKENVYLTLLLNSGWEVSLALSWTAITLRQINENVGFLVKQIVCDEAIANELFEKYYQNYSTTFSSVPYCAQMISFNPMQTNLRKVYARILLDFKTIEANEKAGRFQM
jgi:hypothetical protein